jgi:hypothetical protein
MPWTLWNRVAVVPVEEDWDDPSWLDHVPPLENTEQLPASRCAPSGWLALELDQGCADHCGLSDAELIEGLTGLIMWRRGRVRVKRCCWRSSRAADRVIIRWRWGVIGSRR